MPAAVGPITINPHEVITGTTVAVFATRRGRSFNHKVYAARSAVIPALTITVTVTVTVPILIVVAIAMPVGDFPVGLDPAAGTFIPAAFHVNGIRLGWAGPRATDPDPTSVAISVVTGNPDVVRAGLAVPAFVLNDNNRARRGFAHHNGWRRPKAEAQIDVDPILRVGDEANGRGQEGRGKQIQGGFHVF